MSTVLYFIFIEQKKCSEYNSSPICPSFFLRKKNYEQQQNIQKSDKLDEFSKFPQYIKIQ